MIDAQGDSPRSVNEPAPSVIGAEPAGCFPDDRIVTRAELKELARQEGANTDQTPEPTQDAPTFTVSSKIKNDD
jgi:hypothetical protein